MQLLNSISTQLKSGVNQRLMNILEDIVSKVEIHSDFSIRQPEYKSFDLANDVIEHFQNLPEEMQRKYVNSQLQNFIYSIYYNGSIQSETRTNKEEDNLSLDMENNTILGIDINFYKQLHDHNFGEGYFQPGWSILREESDGALAVTKGGLRLHIQRDKHLQASKKSAKVGDIVAIKLPKNVVQRGFYMAVGNAGLYRTDDLEKQQVTVRIYFNLTPTGAVAIMGGLTQYLNQINIPFKFKVLYHPKYYDRYDSGVLYFDKQDYELVRNVLNKIYTVNQEHFKPEIPLFTKEIAPGLGLAEEPDRKFAERESFGMNRCQIIANGLLAAFYQGDNSPQGRMKEILGEFSRVGIDLDKVHLNPNSEDIYTLLDLTI